MLSYINNSLSEGYLLGKEIVQEAGSQLISVLPAVACAYIDDPQLKKFTNLTAGIGSIVKGMGELWHLNEQQSKFYTIVGCTRDIGIGALLLADTIQPNPMVNGAVVFYYLGASFAQNSRAWINFWKLIGSKCCCTGSADQKDRKKEIAKIIVDFGAATLKSGIVLNNLLKNDFYLFDRQHSMDSKKLIPSISERAYGIIFNKAPVEITFNKDKLYKYDDGGTCSAMALDFASSYNTNCKNQEDTIACVTALSGHYEANTDVFTSVQTAFNTINVADFKLDDEFISHKKMQSLGNYHDLSLTPVTNILNTSSYDQIEKAVEDLPLGSYVVRMLAPADNHKKESYGHTMVFIKNKSKSMFFDNSSGLIKLFDATQGFLKYAVSSWGTIPKIRIYEASCPSNGCVNFAS